MPHVNSPANPTRRHRKHVKKHHDNNNNNNPPTDRLDEQEHKSRSPSPHEHAIPSSPSRNRISSESPRYAESGAISTSAKYAVQSTAIEDNPVPETHHILLFVNPRSGNCHGRILLEELGLQLIQLRTLPNVMIHIYNFLDKDDITGAIQRINSLLRANKGKRKDNPVSINVWSAGGDGTLMSVVQLLEDADVPLKELTFAVIPFGTGNDLSQVLGWGKTIEREQLSDIKKFGELVEERVKGEVTGFDVFEVTITTHEGGGIRKFTSTGFSDVTTRLDTHMGNYSGVGVQGWVGGDFEHSRTGHRLWNIAMYAYQSARWIWRGFDKIQNIDRIEAGGKIAAVGKNSQPAKDAKKRGQKIPVLAAEPIEFVIQNIPGIWGRAIDLWDNAETGHGVINGEGPTDEKNWTQQRCDDQQLEVYCITSLSSYAAKQFSETARKHLTRIGQFQSPLTFFFYKIKRGHETCMLIDGEFFYIKDIATLTYTHKRTINMAKGKEAKLDQVTK